MPAPAAAQTHQGPTEAELQQLRTARELLFKMNQNPESRKSLEKAMKVINPDLETEEDVAARIAQPYVAQITELGTKIKSIEEAQAKRDADAAAARDARAVSEQMAWLDSQEFTDEGKASIKKLMTDESIPNVQAAAALFEKRNPKPVSIPGANYQSDSWDLRGPADDKNLESLFKDEDAWADREAASTLNEIRRNAAQVAVA